MLRASQGQSTNQKKKASANGNTFSPHTPKISYDTESGLSYHETEIVFRSKHATNWIRDFNTPSIIKKPVPSKNGVRSLLDLARTKCVMELKELTPEHFESVPWAMAESLWDEVVLRHMESLHGWQLMASAYGDEEEFGRLERRYLLLLRQTPLPLTDYYTGLTSITQKWQVALRISPKQQAVSDVVAISNITNLGALDISDGQLLLDPRPSVFDHRIMRTWAELAKSRRAFQHLRVWLFGWQDNLSEWIFEYLDAFPSLCYVIMTDCKDMHQKNRSSWEDVAARSGWTALHAKRSAKTLRTYLDDKDFQIGNISSLYYQTQTAQAAGEEAEGCRNGAGPVLECWMGTPRPWTHVIDEFPGTRTIWFERTAFCTRHISFDAPKRAREAIKTPELRSSPPSKRPQRKLQEKSKQKRASDAASLLTSLDFAQRS